MEALEMGTDELLVRAWRPADAEAVHEEDDCRYDCWVGSMLRPDRVPGKAAP